MASFLKGFAFDRPRLQLLVLMLILGTGLLPKNSMADGEAPDADPAAAPSTDDAGTTAGPAKASGRANSAGSVQCWDQECAKTGASADDCLKKPAEAGATKEDCESGYCFVEIRHGTEDGTKYGFVSRGCAEAYKPPNSIPCYTVYPKSCLRIDLSGSAWEAEVDKLEKCNEDANTNAAAGRKIRRRRKRKPRDVGAGALCVCNTDLCNDRTSSAPTGVKHLGYNVALVEALLVSIFTLRSLFLVG